MNESGDWVGYGMLLCGLPHLPAVLELKKMHPKLVMGSVDTNGLLYDSIRAGDVLFGIEEQPYLQGYLPVLIYPYASDHHETAYHSIKSGPRFTILPLSEDIES